MKKRINKRMKEIASQADDYARNATGSPDSPRNGKSYNQNYEERFAELFVKECITIIEQDRLRKADDLETEYDDGYVDGMGYAERILKEHFGVSNEQA